MRFLGSYRKMPEYWFYLGYFLMEAGDHKDAIDVLSEAVKMRPGYSDAYYFLGSAYEASGLDIKAFEAYRKAVKADPGSFDAYFSLGVTCGRLGKYTEAVDALKKAVMLEPEYADAHYNLGIAYLFLKDEEAANNVYRILKGLNPDLARKLRGLINRE
ncbi:MAG: tetratricopeptide repeat protein [Nitrospiraceae bacterium]|nr:MAG: tetratricopeptide repeat protein [Nitrospiraceae bacterium]